jgi:hypothetical protein
MASLLCFEQSKLPAPSVAVPQQRRMFVTSTQYRADFGSLAAGDALCNTTAQSVNKGGTWKAYLSSGAEAAPSRMANVGPWVQELADGGTVLTFNNVANLQTTPLAPIAYNERGQTIGFTSYWTGTSGGGVIANTCASWSSGSSSSSGTTGRSNVTSTAWTNDNVTFSCADLASLLCFEQ